MVAPVVPNRQHAGRVSMSYEEYHALPDDGRLVEWVDGEAQFHMPPTIYHQDLTSFLSSLLHFFVNLLELGKVIDPSFEVKLWPNGPSRQPDIFFVSNQRSSLFDPNRFNGGPDLVVETISPSSATLDRITKFREYERAGVNEYWIIDPRPFQQQADFYTRDNEGQFVPAPIDAAGVYASPTLPGFRLRVSDLWQTPLPNPQRVLAEMLIDAPALSEELRAVYREMLRLLS